MKALRHLASPGHQEPHPSTHCPPPLGAGVAPPAYLCIIFVNVRRKIQQVFWAAATSGTETRIAAGHVTFMGAHGRHAGAPVGADGGANERNGVFSTLMAASACFDRRVCAGR